MHHHVHAVSGFNLTLQVAGVNTTVSGPAAQIPASSLQPVQPVYTTSLESLNLTVRVQGAGIVPFSASLQRELVSALLHVSRAPVSWQCNSCTHMLCISPCSHVAPTRTS